MNCFAGRYYSAATSVARRLRWAAGLLLLASAAEAVTVQHEMEVRLIPAAARLEVVAQMTGLEPGPARFELNPRFGPVAASVDGASIGLQRHDRFLTLAVPESSSGVLRLDYSATLPAPTTQPAGAASVAAFSAADGSYLPSGWRWAPWLSGADQSYRITVIAPDPQRVLATGRLESEQLVNGYYRAVFRHDLGVEPSLFAGAYRIGEDAVAMPRLRTYFEAELAGLSAAYLQASRTFIERYSATIGPYPFAQYSVVSAPVPVGLGFPGLAYVSRQILPSPYMQGRSLAHEVLHNWWGNGVHVDYRSGNWAEGLTTFMADYALAEDEGPAAARSMRLGWLRDLSALPASRDRPAVEFVAKAHDATQVIGYGKVAFFFSMLRDALGADVFAAGLQQLWRTWVFRSAAWKDLRASFEQASGRDLASMFAQWLERAGAPGLHIDETRVAERPDGTFELTLALRQDPPAYELAVPVVIESADGREEKTLIVDDRRAVATWRMRDRPTVLRIDPEYRLLRKLAPGELPPIIRDVTLSDRVKLLIVGHEAEFARRARALAERLTDGAARATNLLASEQSDEPLLIVGRDDQLAPVLAALGIVRPAEVQVPAASVRVWVTRRKGGAEVLTVAARDERALGAVAGPLPYYRRRGYVAFLDRDVVAAGNWPASDGPMIRRFD